MTRKLRARFYFALNVAWIAVAGFAASADPAAAGSYSDIPGCTSASLPSNDPRYPAAQLVVTCIPATDARVSWNGALVVAIHGYVEPREPLTLPGLDDNSLKVTRALLDLGYAFATTSFHKNGYAVEQAGDDVDALVGYFNRTARPADRVLLLGASEGGLITTMLVERRPAIYAGGLALCGPLGGANMELDYLTDFRVLFDYFFPQVFDFGASDVPPTADLNWAGYAALIRSAITAEPHKAEQLFRVTGAARPSDGLEDTIDTATRLLRYTVFGFNDVVQVAGGNPYGNVGRVYAGSDDDVALNRGVERITANAAARAYLDRFYLPTGRLQRPLVTLHTRRDPIVPFAHQSSYERAVEQAGSEQMHAGFSVNRFGHCNFTPAEVLAAVALLVQRADAP